MTTHWAHVMAGYVLVVGGFIGLAAASWLRHAMARRMLALLDPRRGAEARRQDGT